MSAQIRKKNDRSKLVEQDFGRRLYATDLAYSAAMKQTTQKHMDSMMLIKQSEFKKPYREDNYSTMEYAFEPPNPPDFPPGPGWPTPDCIPKGDAVGGGSHLCEDGISCGQWIFTCAHRIISFEVVQDFGWIQSVVYGANDTVTVTVCWNEADRDAGRKIGPKAILANGKEVISTFDFGTCCPTTKTCNGKCTGCPPPVIGYTSQQMSCGGTQTLTHTSGGAGGKYTWAADYGTFSKPTGTEVVYTAPSANGNCANNPTITLTDCCGHKGTVKFAVNCYTGIEAAAKTVICDFEKKYTCYIDGSNRPVCLCETQLSANRYKCDGTYKDNTGACSYNGATVTGPSGETCLGYCPEASFCAARPFCSAMPAGSCGGVLGATIDLRTVDMKAQGCCPSQLL